MISVICPTCGARLRARDELKGQVVLCPKCDHATPVGFEFDPTFRGRSNETLGLNDHARRPNQRTRTRFIRWIRTFRQAWRTNSITPAKIRQRNTSKEEPTISRSKTRAIPLICGQSQT